VSGAPGVRSDDRPAVENVSDRHVHRSARRLEDRLRKGGRGGPDSERAGQELATYEALLADLTRLGAFPDDEALREYVAGLAKAIDEANGYEQAALEHRALGELVRALTAAARRDVPPTHVVNA
jgi:hypothetical protein